MGLTADHLDDFLPSKQCRIYHETSGIQISNIYKHMGFSENVGYIPNEIAIVHRDNDQQNHWLQWGTQHFQTHPYSNHGNSILINPWDLASFIDVEKP